MELGTVVALLMPMNKGDEIVRVSAQLFPTAP